MPGQDGKYNVLFVNPFSQDISGADESLSLIIRGLNKENYNPIVALPAKSQYAKRYEELGAKVVIVPFTRIRRSLNPVLIFTYLFSLFFEVIRFRKIIKRFNIDLVHTNMEVVLSSGIAAKLCKVKSVYHYRNNAYDRPKIVFDTLIKILNAIADRIFVISRATGEAFFKRGIRGKVIILYNAIETARFASETKSDFFLKNFGVKKGNKIVTTVGRIHKRKNLEEFLLMAKEILKSNKNVVFFVVGDASLPEEMKYKEKLLTLAKKLELSDSVIFAGRQNAIPHVMNSSDIITISSFHEGFGRVIVEAMALGKPVVGCDSGAVPEVMDYCECGIVYPIKDIKAFSAAVIKLLKDPDECKRLGEAGKKRVLENFTIDIQKKRIGEVYAELLRI